MRETLYIIFEIKFTKNGNTTKPKGSIKKGGYNNEVNIPKIKNLKKINQIFLLFEQL